MDGMGHLGAVARSLSVEVCSLMVGAAGADDRTVTVRVWQVSRYDVERGRTGIDDQAHVVYSLSARAFEQHVRVSRGAADRVVERLQSGRRVRRARWRVPLGRVKEISFDPASSRLVITVSRLERRRLDPTNTQEAVAVAEIYEALREWAGQDSETLRAISGWHRLASVVPTWPRSVGLVMFSMGLAQLGWFVFAAFVGGTVGVVALRWWRRPRAEIQVLNPAEHSPSARGVGGN